MIFVDSSPFTQSFAYYNQDKEVEFIEVNRNSTIAELNINSCDVLIYTEDIPNLIKALQAAYNFWEKNNGRE